jgi:hypothetical protein
VGSVDSAIASFGVVPDDGGRRGGSNSPSSRTVKLTIPYRRYERNGTIPSIFTGLYDFDRSRLRVRTLLDMPSCQLPSCHYAFGRILMALVELKIVIQIQYCRTPTSRSNSTSAVFPTTKLATSTFDALNMLGKRSNSPTIMSDTIK